MWLVESNRDKHAILGLISFIIITVIDYIIINTGNYYAYDILKSMTISLVAIIFGAGCLEFKDYLYNGKYAWDWLDFIATCFPGSVILISYLMFLLRGILRTIKLVLSIPLFLFPTKPKNIIKMKQLSKDRIIIKETQTIHVFDQYATLIHFDTANCIVNILSEDLFTYSESSKSEIEIIKADNGQSIFFKNEEIIKKIIEHSVPDHRLNILKVYATSKKDVLLCVVSLERTKYKINNVSSKTESPVYLYKLLLDDHLDAVYMKPCFSLTDYFGVVYDKNLIHTDILRYLYYNSDSDILYCVNSTRISVIGGIINNNPVKLYDNTITGGGVRSIEAVTNKDILTSEINSFKRGLWRVDTIMIDLVGNLYLKQLSSITYDIISRNAYTDSTGNIKFLNKKYKVFEEFKKYNKIRFCFLLREVQYD